MPLGVSWRSTRAAWGWRGLKGGTVAPCGPGEKIFSPHPHHPICPCACAGASLIYPKLSYTLLLLPILYCVNRAPPENRMIMRFLPSHFCNPLQTDVNRLQTDAFGVQSDAIGCVCASLRCVPRALGCAADAMENLQEPGRGLRKMQPWKYGLKNSARPNPAAKNTAPMLAAVPRAWGLFVH